METNDSDILDLKQIIGAMIFGANRSLSLKDMQRTLRAVGEEAEGPAKAYATVRESEIAQALESLIVEFDRMQAGIHIAEVAGGFRFQSDPQCGIWLRHLLDKGSPSRLSQPGLETLAVIAYRQPITRSQIEAIRGVSVDHVVRKLLEMQLIRITGRSELPGRPFMYGTTHYFLEHFGLRDLNQLEEVNPMLKRRDAAVSVKAAQAAAIAAGDEPDGEQDPAGEPEDLDASVAPDGTEGDDSTADASNGGRDEEVDEEVDEDDVYEDDDEEDEYDDEDDEDDDEDDDNP